MEYTAKYVAKPGCSEHHTGLAIDVGILLDGKLYRAKEDLLSVEHLFEIIHKKLSRYGFILRYPKGKQHITEIAYEPWHYRFVGREAATDIYIGEMTFEQYLQLAVQV